MGKHQKHNLAVLVHNTPDGLVRLLAICKPDRFGNLKSVVTAEDPVVERRVDQIPEQTPLRQAAINMLLLSVHNI